MIPLPVAAVLERAPAPFVLSELPACKAAQLSFGVDGEKGDLDGMSHSGTLLVLRNLGAQPCRVPALPRLTFAGANHEVLQIAFRPPPGLHPGPVVVPVGVAPGAEVTAALRWVSQDVYAPGRCFAPVAVTVSFDSEALTRPFSGRICGPASSPATYDQQWFRADPKLQQ